MYIEKVLKRKDASSVIVAVVSAFIISTWLPGVVWRLADKITGSNSQYGLGGSWKAQYLQPFVMMVLQFVVLELALRLYVWVHKMFTSK